MADLMTTAQAAHALGVSPRRVRALVKRRADFPRPVLSVRGAHLWSAEQITQWADTADRSVGRPRKETTQR